MRVEHAQPQSSECLDDLGRTISVRPNAPTDVRHCSQNLELHPSRDLLGIAHFGIDAIANRHADDSNSKAGHGCEQDEERAIVTGWTSRRHRRIEHPHVGDCAAECQLCGVVLLGDVGELIARHLLLTNEPLLLERDVRRPAQHVVHGVRARLHTGNTLGQTSGQNARQRRNLAVLQLVQFPLQLLYGCGFGRVLQTQRPQIRLLLGEILQRRLHRRSSDGGNAQPVIHRYRSGGRASGELIEHRAIAPHLIQIIPQRRGVSAAFDDDRALRGRVHHRRGRVAYLEIPQRFFRLRQRLMGAVILVLQHGGKLIELAPLHLGFHRHDALGDGVQRGGGGHGVRSLELQTQEIAGGIESRLDVLGQGGRRVGNRADLEGDGASGFQLVRRGRPIEANVLTEWLPRPSPVDDGTVFHFEPQRAAVFVDGQPVGTRNHPIGDVQS